MPDCAIICAGNFSGTTPVVISHVDVVHRRREPLGEPPGVREHDRRPVREHLLDDRLVDVRPDRSGRLQPGLFGFARPGRHGFGRAHPELGHVFDRHDDPQVERLRRGRLHDRHRGRRRRGTARPPRSAARSPTARCVAQASRGGHPIARASPRGAPRASTPRPRGSRRRSPSRRRRGFRGPPIVSMR